MSANESSSEQPPTGESIAPSLDSPPSTDASIAPPPADFPPTRSISQQPRWPHPNFWWSWLWCLLFMLLTQIPGALIAVLVVAVLALVAPDQFPEGASRNQAALLKSEPMGVALAVAFFITELLVVGFSLLVIRLVVGRDWTRQLAMRRPGVAHTLLALASLPALVLLAKAAYEVLRDVLHVPSLSNAGMPAVATFLFAELLVIAAGLLIMRLSAGRGWARQLASRPRTAMRSFIELMSFSAGLAAIYMVYVALRVGLGIPTTSEFKLSGMEEMIEIFSKWPWGFAVLVIGLGPGVGEELWCRGFLGRGLVGHYGVILGAIATSFFFGLIHVDPCQGTMAMVMGLWLHFVYLTTRSLWLPMLLHFLNNSLAVVASRIPHLEIVDAKASEIPAAIYVTAVVLLIGVAYALYQSRARLAATTPEQLFLWRPAYEGVEYPPSDSSTRIVHPMPSILAVAVAGGGFLLFVAACMLIKTVD